jgi:hypothetical protein
VVLAAAIAGLVGLLFGYDTGVIAAIGLFTLWFCWEVRPRDEGQASGGHPGAVRGTG